MARVGVHSLVAPLAGGVQVIQQVAVDEPFGRQPSAFEGSRSERTGGVQGFGTLALAVLGPAMRHAQDDQLASHARGARIRPCRLITLRASCASGIWPIVFYPAGAPGPRRRRRHHAGRGRRRTGLVVGSFLSVIGGEPPPMDRGLCLTALLSLSMIATGRLSDLKSRPVIPACGG